MPEPQRLPLPDASLLLYSGLSLGNEETVMRRLIDGIHWRQEYITLFGKTHKQPRLVAWYGDRNAVYTYSGKAYTPRPWTEELLRLRDLVEVAAASPPTASQATAPTVLPRSTPRPSWGSQSAVAARRRGSRDGLGPADRLIQHYLDQEVDRADDGAHELEDPALAGLLFFARHSQVSLKGVGKLKFANEPLVMRVQAETRKDGAVELHAFLEHEPSSRVFEIDQGRVIAGAPTWYIAPETCEIFPVLGAQLGDEPGRLFGLVMGEHRAAL